MLLALGSTGLVVRVDPGGAQGFYQGQGDARYLREMPSVSRGTIFDRNGDPWPLSTPMESIWVQSACSCCRDDRLPELAPALGIET